MRGLRTFLVVAFLVCGGLIVASLRSAPHRILLQDVTVIDGTGGTAQQHRDILINGDRIEAVGPTGGLSADGAEQVPLAGRFVTPGFVDMHAHLLNHPWDEKGQIRPRWDRNGVVEMLRMLLDYGVTTVRDPGSETEAAVTWRGAIAKGSVVGPTLFTAGRILNSSDFDPEPFMPVKNHDEIRREIAWHAAVGVDAVKVHAGMPPAMVKVVVDEARKYGLPVLGLSIAPAGPRGASRRVGRPRSTKKATRRGRGFWRGRTGCGRRESG